MTDYLGRLAARTIAPRTSVRPRVASAFEPQLEQEELVPALRRGGLRPPEPPVAELPAPEPPVAELPMPELPMPEARRFESPEVESTEVESPRVERPEFGRPQAAPTSSVVTNTITNDVTHEVVHEVPYEVIHERERIVPRTVNRERIVNVHERTPPSTTPPPPPIEITIGRIDVRAVIAATPPKPEPKRPSIMTLEEYVAKRDGGGR